MLPQVPKNGRLTRCHAWIALLLAAAALMAGCGDEEALEETRETISLEVLRTRILLRLEHGRGLETEEWQEDVMRLAELLWPDRPPPAAARIHTDLMRIAGDTAQWASKSDAARTEWERDNPLDVEIKNAVQAALEGGAQAYAAWCAAEGMALHRRFTDERRKAHGG